MERRLIDGIEIVFKLVPGSEAPAEMLMHFPQLRVLNMAEDVTTDDAQSLHHPRRRGPRRRAWSRYIGEALEVFGASSATS